MIWMALIVAGLIAIFAVAVAAKPKLHREPTEASCVVVTDGREAKRTAPAEAVLSVAATGDTKRRSDHRRYPLPVDSVTVEVSEGLYEISIPGGRVFRDDHGKLYEWPSCRQIINDEWGVVRAEIDRHRRRARWGAPTEVDAAPRGPEPEKMPRRAPYLGATGMAYPIVGSGPCLNSFPAYDSVYRLREDDE